MNKERETGPDLVRVIACFFVVAAHFYLNCGYYNEMLVGKKMFIMTSCRWLFVTAVPLFFMLTGYFKIHKKADRSHYMSLITLAISYVVVSVAKMFLYNYLYGQIYTALDMFKNLGNYQIAWYMGMYLCVFLLIPFINKMWASLDDKEKIILIATLIFLCAIYPVFNYIAPSFFYGIYPLMFYFIGAYIREKQPVFNRIILIIIAVAVSVLEAVISFSFTTTGLFDWTVISTSDGTYGTIFIAICAVCLFLAFYKVKINSKILQKLFSAISNVSFEIYLFAGAFDAIIYQYLKRTITGANNFFWWFFVTVPLSFICAFISSWIFRKIVDLIVKSISAKVSAGKQK